LMLSSSHQHGAHMLDRIRSLMATIAHWIDVAQPKLGRLQIHPPRPIEVPRRYSRLRRFTGSRNPTFAVVTPSFNQAPFLDATIRSVLDQGYSDLDYIVMDGGSIDGTRAILNRWSPHLRFVSEPDGGQAAAINAGFARVRGDIMGYLNSDDLFLPGALTTLAAFFDRYPDVDCVYGHRVIVDANGMEIGRWVLPPHDDEILSWADYVPQETLFWRRHVWDKVGGLDTSFSFAMDWDLLLRFRDSGAKIVRVPQFLGAFRVHDLQKTSSQIATIGAQEMDQLRFRSLGRVPHHTEINAALGRYMRSHLMHDLAYRMGLLRY
jgi:glycosyltransferase involved in cell wall biosynthesis